jgi:hypothetical protein
MLVNADGLPGNHTGMARIESNQFGVTVYPHNNVKGIAGKWGFMQSVRLKPGCYLMKIIGEGRINDPPHPQNFAASSWIDGVENGKALIPLQGRFEHTFAFKIEKERDVTCGFYAEALWATAGHGSQIHFYGVGIEKVSDDHCQ